jgi:hypothetical protein
MNRGSVETATSFNPAIAGHFEWTNEDRTVTFIPDAALIRTNYTGIVLGAAQDATGANCAKSFVTRGAGDWEVKKGRCAKSAVTMERTWMKQ